MAREREAEIMAERTAKERATHTERTAKERATHTTSSLRHSEAKMAKEAAARMAAIPVHQSCSTIAVGSRARIHGLVGRVDLNDKCGTVAAWVNGRYAILLDGSSDDALQIKESNLVCLPAAPALSISELKAELRSQGVDYGNCIEKSELQALLALAKAKASPTTSTGPSATAQTTAKAKISPTTSTAPSANAQATAREDLLRKLLSKPYVGSRVRLHSLTQRPDLNNRYGVVTAKVEGRYEISLDDAILRGSNDKLRIQEDNLFLLSTEPRTAANL
eukprot:4520197-Prymnesium_polylepis.1